MGVLKCSNCAEKNEYPDGSPEWMTTYSDMVTLLLTFFVLMLAMATFDPIKFTSVSEAFSKSFGLMPSFDSPMKRKRQKQPLREKFNTEEERMRGIGYRMKKSFAKGTVETDITKEGLRITLKSIGNNDVQFVSGGADLGLEMEKILHALAKEIKEEELEGNRIIISGHTDRHKVMGGKYGDNWGLSMARARAVQRFLIGQVGDDNEPYVNEKKTAISAYADTDPLVSEQTATADKKNRRIEIFIRHEHEKNTESTN